MKPKLIETWPLSNFSTTPETTGWTCVVDNVIFGLSIMSYKQMDYNRTNHPPEKTIIPSKTTQHGNQKMAKSNA